ncbi:hypothetical protein PENARI_c084G10114 [Penicillium arizonense]|uniref:Uncharacterized protein n=1 Tax=Penicillium arizonense TaxID=1835702 RepID=A0A1F5L1N3_PENAI|nr:hypothetical protein PENARI_c084G10114 [Penicillium arizonense]OGE46947.1 hypothetical protein PENARI_c084G10114 [Penicillium arizonense]
MDKKSLTAQQSPNQYSVRAPRKVMAYTPFLALSLQTMQHVLKYRKLRLWATNRTHKPRSSPSPTAKTLEASNLFPPSQIRPRGRRAIVSSALLTAFTPWTTECLNLSVSSRSGLSIRLYNFMSPVGSTGAFAVL